MRAVNVSLAGFLTAYQAPTTRIIGSTRLV